MTTPHKELDKNFQSSASQAWEGVKPWLVAFSLPVVVGLLGATVFAPLVKASIQNASHPSLVYGIFIVFVLGVLLAAVTLRRFQKEKSFVQQWVQLPDNEQRRAWVERKLGHAKFTVYPVLCAVVLRMSAAERQAKFEHEVRACESGLADRLVFPNFIAGALVGLGLVGTFVGLLGTLDDLGLVFGSLAKTGDSGANPTAVFSDMVQKLQDPMRGMGTAFVTSLYGLLGSLILGVTSLSISKQANVIVKDLYAAERLYALTHTEQVPAGAAQADTQADATQAAGGLQMEAMLKQLLALQLQKDAQTQRWLELAQERLNSVLEAMVQTHRQAVEQPLERQQKSAQAMLSTLEQLVQSSRQCAEQAQDQQRQLGETVRLLAQQINGDRTLIHRDLMALVEKNHNQTQHDVSQLEVVLSGALTVTEKSARNIERFLQVQQEALDALPKTAYWREAWVKVQHFLGQSKQQQDLSALARAVERQTMVMQHLADQLSHQDWMTHQGTPASAQSKTRPT